MKVISGRMNQRGKEKTQRMIMERDAFRKEREDNMVKCAERSVIISINNGPSTVVYTFACINFHNNPLSQVLLYSNFADEKSEIQRS